MRRVGRSSALTLALSFARYQEEFLWKCSCFAGRWRATSSLSFPPCLSSAALRARLGNEESRAAGVGWGGTEVTGARCIQTTGPRGIRHHQHVPRVIVIPQAMSHLKCS